MHTQPTATKTERYGRQARLEAQGYSGYVEYMRSDAWWKTKQRYRASKMPQTCRICDSSPVDLHHRSYARIGHENLHDLVPLCRSHHVALHKVLRVTPRQDWWMMSRKWVAKQRRLAIRRGRAAPS